MLVVPNRVFGGSAPRLGFWRGPYNLRAVFSSDGRELFYAEQSGGIMAVAVHPDGSFGTPRKLFDWPTIAIPGFGRTFDVTADGKRFLMIKEADEKQAGSSDINIAVNWVEELKQRLPVD